MKWNLSFVSLLVLPKAIYLKLPKFLNYLNALEILPLKRASRESQNLDFI